MHVKHKYSPITSKHVKSNVCMCSCRNLPYCLFFCNENTPIAPETNYMRFSDISGSEVEAAVYHHRQSTNPGLKLH